jgi:hypothetical protein
VLPGRRRRSWPRGGKYYYEAPAEQKIEQVEADAAAAESASGNGAPVDVGIVVVRDRN